MAEDRSKPMNPTDLSPSYLRSRGMELEAQAVEYTHSPEGKAEAERRVREALDAVERAQRELERACSVLSSLAWANPMQIKVGKVCDQVQALWRRMAYAWPAREKIRVDGITAMAIVRKCSQAGG